MSTFLCFSDFVFFSNLILLIFLTTLLTIDISVAIPTSRSPSGSVDKFIDIDIVVVGEKVGVGIEGKVPGVTGASVGASVSGVTGATVGASVSGVTGASVGATEASVGIIAIVGESVSTGAIVGLALGDSDGESVGTAGHTEWGGASNFVNWVHPALSPSINVGYASQAFVKDMAKKFTRG